MALNPSELRNKAAARREEKLAAANALARKKAREKKKRIEEVQEGALERYISFLDREIDKAATDGQLSVKIEIDTFVDYSYNRSERAEAMWPIWCQVVNHYRELGFQASKVIDNETEYYSDGAGPGPVTHIWMKISWKDAE